MRKLVGNDGLTGKAKGVHTRKANQGIHSPLLVGRQVFSQSSITSSGDKCHHSKGPALPLLPPAVTAEQDAKWGGTCFG